MAAVESSRAEESGSYMALADAAAQLGTTPEGVLERLLKSPWSDSILVERRAISGLAIWDKPSGGGGVVSE